MATRTERLKALYTGAVADALDRLGYRHQLLPSRVNPVTFEMKVAGTAFTCQFVPSNDINHKDTPTRTAMVSAIGAGDILVGATTEGGEEASHWGELLSRGVMAHGAVGAVIDGGLRDTDECISLGFPIFYSYRHAADADGRWDIAGWQIPVRIGPVEIHPGDYVLADIDGVVIVPESVIDEVLTRAEEIGVDEVQMRVELDAGALPADVFITNKI